MINTSRRVRSQRKVMSEINVVPYIDVMLVLLIIFMTTAPLLTEGVQVDLPQASADLVENETSLDNFIVSVDASGSLFVNDDENISMPEQVRAKAAAVLKYQPKTPFYVKGDASVAYDYVMQAMIMLQEAGVPSVGLVTQPESQE